MLNLRIITQIVNFIKDLENTYNKTNQTLTELKEKKMKFKNTGAQKSTITRDVNDFVDKTDNIFKAVSVMAKRSAQVNEKMKAELMLKLEEFALTQEQLDEVFENQEQIAVSKFYESLPKPWAIAMKELLNDEIYMRDADAEESVGDSNNNA